MREINGGKQMKDVWTFTSPKKDEKRYGKHPTQNPESLLERIILSSSSEGDLVLDIFAGAGTTPAISIENDRQFIGFEIDNKYYKICQNTIKYYKTIKIK